MLISGGFARVLTAIALKILDFIGGFNRASEAAPHPELAPICPVPPTYELSLTLQYPAVFNQIAPRTKHVAAAIGERDASHAVTLLDVEQAKCQTVCLGIKGLFNFKHLKLVL